MNLLQCITRPAVVLGSLLVLACSGCGNGAAAVPTNDAARTALDSALAAWTKGAKPGEVPGSEPPIVVHDSLWGRGRQLASFEILKEEEGAAAEKRFLVRLALSKPEQTEEVQYHVLGVSPLMVFRDEDYQRNINMENGPALIRSGSRGRKSR